MDYNWWDDRTVEECEKETNHPCYGCCDYFEGECLSNGACADFSGKTHVIKINKDYFLDVAIGRKKFEVRLNDRDYRVGDIVIMEEVFNGYYTGKCVKVVISYILDDFFPIIAEGYIVFSFDILEVEYGDL